MPSVRHNINITHSHSHSMDNEMMEVQSGQPMELVQIQERIDTMLAGRSYIVEKIKPILIPEVDIYTLPGMKKPSLGKPGSEKLAKIFGLSSKFSIDKETMEAIGELPAGKRFVAFVCDLFDKSGAHMGQGRGATFVEFYRTNYRSAKKGEYEEASKQPGFNPSDWKQARGNYGPYWRVKDGEVFDELALNKAIKMAQKSAYVDAVIRATGMSDLFTQDLEDMKGLDVEEEAPSAPQEPSANTEQLGRWNKFVDAYPNNVASVLSYMKTTYQTESFGTLSVSKANALLAMVEKKYPAPQPVSSQPMPKPEEKAVDKAVEAPVEEKDEAPAEPYTSVDAAREAMACTDVAKAYEIIEKMESAKMADNTIASIKGMLGRKFPELA